MTVLPIVQAPASILFETASPVDLSKDKDSLTTLIANMIDTLYDAQGIGLAAPQVDISKRVIVVDLQNYPDNDPDDYQDTSKTHTSKTNMSYPVIFPLVLINPEITSFSPETIIYDEGCLSIPDIRADVQRALSIQVVYQDIHQNTHSLTANDLLSICIQHEIDHLNGILFIDRLSRLKREMYYKKIRKM